MFKHRVIHRGDAHVFRLYRCEVSTHSSRLDIALESAELVVVQEVVLVNVKELEHQDLVFEGAGEVERLESVEELIAGEVAVLPWNYAVCIVVDEGLHEVAVFLGNPRVHFINKAAYVSLRPSASRINRVRHR